MSMDRDIRLAEIPSCNEKGWTHEKIMDLIAYTAGAFTRPLHGPT
jgi:hypothetical protein